MKNIIYLVLLVGVFFLANFCYVFFGIYDRDIVKCNAELVYKLDSSIKKSNILYFGESSNFTFSEHDSCKKSIAEIVSEFNPNYKVAAITKGAIHAKAYDLLIHRIKNNSTVKIIIVTINLRSFGINWIQSDLETNLSRANVLYNNYPPIIKKLMLSFKVYDNVEKFKRKNTIKLHCKNDKFTLISKKYETIRDWDKVVYNKGILDVNGVKNQQQTDLACHFIKNYAFTLNANNPRIKDLDNIVNYCNEKKIKLIYNLLPENYEKAIDFFDKDLVILMHSNVSFLKNRYEKNTIFINNFDILKDSCFIDRNWPTEHYVYYGRRTVAQKISEKLQIILDE